MATDVYGTGHHQWVVPAGVVSLSITVAGAGSGVNLDSGFGGIVQGDLAVTPGDTVHLYVGEDADARQGGSQFGGGADGGDGGTGYLGADRGGGGGAASDVRLNGTAAGDRVMVAGGGGGPSWFRDGGGGGYPTGNTGDGSSGGGQGGTQTAAGNGSQSINGANGQSGNLSGANGGGGGGGGYYGGNGGFRGGGAPNGGGGGSSWTHPSLVTEVSHQNDTQSGDGSVSIEWFVPAIPLVIEDNNVGVSSTLVGLTPSLDSDDSLLPVTSESVSLQQDHSLGTHNASIPTSSEQLHITLEGVLVVGPSDIGVTSDLVSLTQKHELTTHDADVPISSEHVVLVISQSIPELGSRDVGSQRVERFRFMVEDTDGFQVGEIHPVIGGSITLNTSRGVFRTLTGMQLVGPDIDVINPARHVVRVLAHIQSEKLVSVGVFRFTSDSRVYTSKTGWQMFDGDMADLSITLDQPTGEAISVGGTPADVTITRLLEKYAPPYVSETMVVEGNSEIVSTQSWSPESELLRVLNDICIGHGYFPAHFDRDGVLRIRKQTLASSVDTPLVNWDSELLLDSAVVSRNWLSTPTEWIVISSSETSGPVVGKYELPSSHNMSYASRGFKVTKVISTQGIVSKTHADRIARYEAAIDSDAVVELDTEGLLDTRHDVFDTVEFNNVKWLEREWTMRLEAGGAMTHRADRQLVDLEQVT